MLSMKSPWESIIYKMKLRKIKQHFTVFALGRALTRANTDLAFLGLHKRFYPPFFQHFSSYSVLPDVPFWSRECLCGGQHRALVSEAAAPALCWAAAGMCGLWGSTGSAALGFLIPWTLFYLRYLFVVKDQGLMKIWITEEAKCMSENMVGIWVANL